jgi:hypothetical protein
MSYNMMISRLCYDIYDCFTLEHFRSRQRMTFTIKIYCSRLYLGNNDIVISNNNFNKTKDCNKISKNP